MSPKARGRLNELRSMEVLEAAGYYCVRSHLSEGLFDVIGISSTDVVLVQVKARDWVCGAELEALRMFQAPPNCRKLMHRYPPYKRDPEVKEIA